MPLLLFVAALSLYVRTLYPSVAGGDSGELVAVAYKLGVAHPPGYPLYTLLAHAFTWLPAGTIAWRVNLLSAVCDAAAAALLAAAVRRVTGDAVAAAFAGLLFAFSPLVWTYATHAEVFALNNFFVALLVWLAARWNESRDPVAAVPIAFTLGLGLTNHHTLAFFGVALVAWIAIATRGAIFAPRVAARLGAAFALGLLPYAYLPLAARHATTMSWGDPTTFSGFFDVLLRRDYGTFRLSGNTAVTPWTFARHVGSFLASFARGSLFAGAILAAGAMAGATLRSSPRDARARSFVLLLAAGIACSIGIFASMANLPLDDPFYLGITSRFWQQPEALAFALAGIGLAFVHRRSARALRAAIGVAAGAVVAMQIVTNFHSHDESANRYVEDYGRAILADLPERAILLVYGDLISNAVRYVHTCEGVRRDVVVLDQEMMTKPWYVERARREHGDLRFPGRAYHPRIAGDFDMQTFVEANRTARSIHVYPGVKGGDEAWMQRYALLPDGISQRILAKGEFNDAIVATVGSDASRAPLRALPRPDANRYADGTWERVVLNDRKTLFHSRGVWLLDRALARKDDRAMFESAVSALSEAAAQWEGAAPWYVSKNLGLAASRLSRWDLSARDDAVRAWREYLEHAPADEKDRAAISGEVASYGG